MQRIRERQQKLYEEQALRHAEQKKAVRYLFIYLKSEFLFLFKVETRIIKINSKWKRKWIKISIKWS